MNRDFIINILLVFAINILIKPFYIFGIERTIQNRVGEDYGLFFTLYSFTYLFHILTDLGIRHYNNRNIAQHNFLLEKYFPSLLQLKGWLGLIYLGVIVVVGLCFGYVQKYPGFICLIGVNQLLSSLVAFLRSNISGLGLYQTDSLISTLDRFLLILVLSPLLYLPFFEGHFDISWFIYAQMFTLSLTAFTAFVITRKHIKVLKFTVNWLFLFSLLRQSAPYALAVFLMTAYAKIDAIMIEMLLGDRGLKEADYYASAYRLFEASNMVGVLFAGLLIPMFAKQIKSNSNFKSLLEYSFKMIMGGALVLSITTIFYRTEIMILLYEHGSVYTGNILGWLMVSFLAVSGIYIYSALLTADDQIKKMNQIFVIGLVMNLLLNGGLIPYFQAYGAALATACTEVFVFLGLLWVTFRVFRFTLSVATLIRLLSAMILMIIGAQIIKAFVGIPWFYQFLITGLLGGLIAMATKLVDMKSFLELRQQGPTA